MISTTILLVSTDKQIPFPLKFSVLVLEQQQSLKIITLLDIHFIDHLLKESVAEAGKEKCFSPLQ